MASMTLQRTHECSALNQVTIAVTGDVTYTFHGDTVPDLAPPVVVNNQIDVQPATVEVTLPARESETELVHDDDGNLVRSVTRERTVN